VTRNSKPPDVYGSLSDSGHVNGVEDGTARPSIVELDSESVRASVEELGAED